MASRPMYDSQGLSSMPFLRSMAQMTTSGQATRLPMSTLSPPLLPDPVAPPSKPTDSFQEYISNSQRL